MGRNSYALSEDVDTGISYAGERPAPAWAWAVEGPHSESVSGSAGTRGRAPPQLVLPRTANARGCPQTPRVSLEAQ